MTKELSIYYVLILVKLIDVQRSPSKKKEKKKKKGKEINESSNDFNTRSF